MGVSSKYTKGIEIELGGNATKLKTALDGANRSIRTTQTELDTLENKLKISWDASSFQRAQELAQRSVQQTREKAELLRKALSELDKQGNKAGTEQYEALRRELSYVEVSAQKAEERLTSISKIRMDSITRELEQVSGRLNSAGNALTMGLTVPLAAAGAAAVNFASDTAESVNKVEVAFGYAAEGVKNFSDTSLTSFGLAKGTALDMAALYGDMATSMGFSQAAAADMAKELVGLAGDLSSYKNISVEMSNTALKSIFTGETESLKNLGVVMTEANLKNYAMAQGFKTSYTEMDQTEKVALRLRYVLDATKNSQGDFARTSDGTANQLRIFQESLKEAAAVAGDELLPVITPIIGQLSSLVQGFGDLDEGTRKAVVQTSLFLAALGPMLKLTGGVTAAVNAGVAAYFALTAAKAADIGATIGQAGATTTATAAQTGLNVAMAANPIGLVITAIGALVAALGAFGVASALMSEETENLNQKMRESRELYAQTTAEIKEHKESTVGMAAALQSLVAQEDKTAAQKGAILNLVDQLNQSVPELALAYNAEADSINMTTDSIRQMAYAEAARQEQAAAIERMVAAYQEEIEIADALAEAKDHLLKAEAAYAEYDGAVGSAREQDAAFNKVNQTLAGAKANVEQLTKAQAENAAEIQKLDAEYGSLTDSISDSATAASGATVVLEDFNTVLGKLQGGYEILAKAQKEQVDKGSLSISTVTSLIEKYPDLLQYLVETADGYRLTDGALQDYIGSQRAEYQLAMENAQAAAQAVVNAEKGKCDAINSTTMSIKDQIKALIAFYSSTEGIVSQFGADYKNSDDFYAHGGIVSERENQLQQLLAQMEAAEKNLSTFDRTSSMLGRDTSSGGGSSKKGKTAAEQELEAYREAVKELDHRRAMDEISEADYLERKEALGNQYLKNNLEERRKLDEELYGYQKGEYERDLAALQASLKYKEITQDEFAVKLGELQRKTLKEGTDAWKENDLLQAEARQTAYEERLAALDEALESESITLEEHLAGVQALESEARSLGAEALQENLKRQQDDRDNAYSEEMADQKYFLDMGIISEAEYYRQLAQQRDNYLEADSDAWRQANVELKQYQDRMREEALAALKKALDQRLEKLKDAYDEEVTAIKDVYDDEKDALKDAYDAQKEAAKEAYNAKKDAIKKELDLEKERLNGILEGIDAEIQARRELREDEDQDGAIAAAQKRLDNAKAQLEFARGSEDEEQWRNEVYRLEQALKEAQQKKEDTEFYREKELEKEEVQDQLDAAQKEADGKLDAAEKDYEALTKRLEWEYDASVKRLEADYKTKLAEAEARYEESVERLKNKYESDKDKGSGGAKDDRYNQQEYSDEVRAIARANGVDLGVAQDMHNTNQWNKDTPGYKPYSDGGYSTAGKEKTKLSAQASGIMGAALGAAAASITKTVVQQVSKTNSASVTIHQAPSLTSGQMNAAVRRTLEMLDR